ncbi:leucine-rich repeat-containing protein 43-like isoform X2 [Amia ocellicauda]|uniref:leucine-rich repeat-containing protein 43-like isoform X2 n=1 Tax=Amia ocellicauda TaxID=2972642 RepID=UPI0034648CE5
MSSSTVSTAFEEQLRTLCLKDFPCGLVNWVSCQTFTENALKRVICFVCQRFALVLFWYEANSDPERGSSSGRRGQEKAQWEAGREDPEALIEYLNSNLSPWKMEALWSPQAGGLRELAVRSPGCIHWDFVFAYFTTLRIVDKGVSAVDAGLLRFVNLEELILSANRICDIDSHHLPRTLKVLELCANAISSMSGLCSDPPPGLQHLGLGYSKLSSPADYRCLTAAFWPRLVSLDLSFSGFVEQLGLLDALATLPCLRSLVLQGSPLTLTPSYPGFTLDNLPRLTFLDDVRISPDDRHCFSGLARRRDVIANEAVVIVTIGKMKGVPDPHLPSEDTTVEFPLVTYSYYVTYEFLGSCPQAAPQHTEEQSNNFPQDRGSPVDTAECAASAGTRKTLPEPPSTLRNSHGETCTPSLKTARASERKDRRSPEHPQSHLPCCVDIHRTPGLAWAEVMDHEYKAVHQTRDLTALRAFFLRGLQVTVEEQKALSWPVGPAENSIAKPASDKRGGGKEKEEGKRKPKDKKKQKEPQVEMRQDPPVRRTLGCVSVELQALLCGESHTGTVCDFGVLHTPHSSFLTREKEVKKTKEDRKREEKKADSGRDSTASQRACTSSKGKARTKKNSEADVVTDTAPSPPDPLTLEFTVKLDKWLTAAEACNSQYA